MSLIFALLLTGCPATDSGGKDSDTSGTDEPYHPDGWDAPAEHGMAAKHQDQQCTACHGEDLGGGTAGQSCDTCHASDWRTDCTFCHGGTETVDGAPPEDIDDQDVELSFPEHTAHVEGETHPAWSCDECHTTPDDVLSSGHVFLDDLTAGVAEVAFGDGLSATGAYSAGSCSNLYCHGDGQVPGSVTSGAVLDCGGCHGSAATPGTLSAAHPNHLSAGITCEECHSATAYDSDAIADPQQHVDGEVDVALATGMSYADGTCTGTCHDVVHNGSGWTDGTYHPPGWDDPDQHGLAAKLQTDSCSTCHGAALDGGTSGQDCDSCHEPSWRTDCTYCHGGDENSTGAPPEDIDGGGGISFPEHSAHVMETTHAAWDCDTCHVKPEDVLSDGHLFVADVTPGVAEVALSDGSYSVGTCSNLYCHGDGQVDGSVTTGETTDCGSCHGTSSTPGTLSTVHAEHFDQGATCDECHAATVSDESSIATPALHVDGTAQTEFPSGMVYSGGTCTGSCHGAGHDGAAWEDGAFHPVGWDAADQHGLAANLQTLDCTSCHGDDLYGGTSGQSCDACHTSDWRTDCTYCHGGDENSTGAPPEDIDGGSAVSFPEHSAHVTETNHPAWDCVECHARPADVLSAGHVFIGDTTPAAAEVSVDGSYSAGTCSNLYCHGDGQTVGSVSVGDVTDCGSCHGTGAAPGTLSTVHGTHLDEGATCDECHSATVSDSSTVSTPALHVDGAVETGFPSGMVMSGGTCTGTCHDTAHDGSTWSDDGFHGEGWEEADQHGPAANLQEQDCTSCHGEDLTGGTSGQGCDECHAGGWRTDCTYCHGGDENSTGAPPRDIDSASATSFPEHSAHVMETNHAAWDCVECHTKPEDVLAAGHVYLGDTTPAAAEVTIDGTYSAGTCSNLYCHGDGQTVGSVTIGEVTDCGSCHGTAGAPGTLSAVHDEHLGQGATCDECHAATVSDGATVSTPALHVDGAAQTEFPSGVVFSGGSCTGTCHGVDHSGSTWTDGGFHPAGWDAGAEHGLVANLQEQDCRSCHGDDLTGGTSGKSCDECHAAGWRTDCTYCHGGDENSTGAPPEDIDGSSAISFPEHSAHVTETIHAAWDCDTCHTKPEDVLSDGHVFIGDTTPGVAEVDLDGVYSAGTCADSYCHGDGQVVGSVSIGEVTDCGSCHGTATVPGTLSAAHAGHLSEGITCGDCHSATATGDSTISGPTLHVDGDVDVALVAGMAYSGGLCTGTCHEAVHSGSSWTDGFHPAGWEVATEHGLAANLQDQACTTCHGDELAGGTSGQGCDDCHSADWRTDCTYCHGGTDNTTGAPPEDIDNTTTGLSFAEHTIHVEEVDHPAYGCEECHVTPSDVLDAGHVFLGDTTAAVAELDFSAGLSDAGAWSLGSCTNLYCHGNGHSTLGTVTTGATTSCTSCHGGKGSTTGMSGEHRKHLGTDVGAGCTDCHATVAASNTSILDATLHVDGSIQVSPLSTLTWTGSRCTGSCHGEAHNHSDSW